MAFGFLKKIPGGFIKGLKAVDKIGDAVDDIPFAENLLLMIPVAGPIAKMVFDEVDYAEKAVTGSGKGTQKLGLVLERLGSKLRAEGHDFSQKELVRLVDNAVQVRNGEAFIMEGDPEGPAPDAATLHSSEPAVPDGDASEE